MGRVHIFEGLAFRDLDFRRVLGIHRRVLCKIVMESNQSFRNTSQENGLEGRKAGAVKPESYVRNSALS